VEDQCETNSFPCASGESADANGAAAEVSVGVADRDMGTVLGADGGGRAVEGPCADAKFSSSSEACAVEDAGAVALGVVVLPEGAAEAEAWSRGETR